MNEVDDSMVMAMRNVISREHMGLEEMKKVMSEEKDNKLIVQASKERRNPIKCSIDHPVQALTGICQ